MRGGPGPGEDGAELELISSATFLQAERGGRGGGHHSAQMSSGLLTGALARCLPLCDGNHLNPPLTSPACCVQAGIGISLSSLWVIGHIYVLCHTSEYSLREQRLGRKKASD